nr:hypothetical protein [Ectobacillus panaciterrae]
MSSFWRMRIILYILLHVYKPIYAGLAFAALGNEQEIASILETRIKEIKGLLQTMKDVYTRKVGKVPRAQLHILAGVIEHMYTELRWLIRLHEDVVHNRLAEKDTFIEELRMNE